MEVTVIDFFADSPGDIAFYGIVHYCITGQPDTAPVEVHNTYKENNPQ